MNIGLVKERSGVSRRGFSLIEMLVVIGIISVLVGASVVGFSGMSKTAEKAKAQELVSNVATALTVMFQNDGVWPRRLAANGATDGRLDEAVSLALAKGRYLSLSMDNADASKATRLIGHDRFGIVTPWAQAVIKRLGTDADKSTQVTGSSTVEDHVLHYALDLDGDGRILGVKVGDETVDIRATAAVWCIGKSGGQNGQPWPYSKGLRKDDVYSWTPGQTQDVN